MAHARDELGIDLEELDQKTNPWQVRFLPCLDVASSPVLHYVNQHHCKSVWPLTIWVEHHVYYRSLNLACCLGAGSHCFDGLLPCRRRPTALGWSFHPGPAHSPGCCGGEPFVACILSSNGQNNPFAFFGHVHSESSTCQVVSLYRCWASWPLRSSARLELGSVSILAIHINCALLWRACRVGMRPD